MVKFILKIVNNKLNLYKDCLLCNDYADFTVVTSPAGYCTCKDGFYKSKETNPCLTRDCYACSPCYPNCKTCSDSTSTCTLIYIILIYFYFKFLIILLN